MRRDDPFLRELDKINIDDGVLDKANLELDKKPRPKFKWRPAYTIALIVCCLIAIMTPILAINRMPASSPETSIPGENNISCTIDEVNNYIDAFTLMDILDIEYISYSANKVQSETAGTVYPYYYSVTLNISQNERIVITIDRNIDDNLWKNIDFDDSITIKNIEYKVAMIDGDTLKAVAQIEHEKVYIEYTGNALDIKGRVVYLVDEMTI